MKSSRHLLLVVLATLFFTMIAIGNAAAVNDTISVTVNGLSGTLVLQDDKADTLTYTASGTKTFATSYTNGSTYSVTVQTQPATQTCTLSRNASGTITGNITVTANCVNSFTLSVAVTGLTGTLVMQDSKNDTLTFTANNTQTFATSYLGGTAYTVTVKTQPAGQTCTLSSNSVGSITANTTVTATCSGATNPTISVAVSGLTGTLVMQDDKSDNLTFTANGTKTFATAYTSGSTYTVSVKTQPTGQTCTLSSNATGTITANTTVTATCSSASSPKISVAVTGLTGTLVMQDDKADNLTFTANGTQTFATAYTSGSTYTVSVKTQPTGQTCTLSSNATGTITANVTVTATCAATTNPKISVAVSGLVGTLILQDDKLDILTFTANGTKTFPKAYINGSTYTVSITTQPIGQTCTLSSNATGTITANTTVTATCSSSSSPKISVAVTGLTGTLVMQDDKADNLTFTGNTTQTFATAYTSGSTYTVSVKTQPAGQTCTLSSNATGTITANVTVTATCSTTSTNLTISVAVTGLVGTLVVQDGPSDNLTFTSNTTQTFSKLYGSGASYVVLINSQPTGQVCTLSSNATGTITSNVTVTATCASNDIISVKTVGLVGTLVVQDDKADSLTFTTNKTLSFATSYVPGSTYLVSIQTQPAGQTCTLSSNASGTINANLTVTATCSTSNFTISVAVQSLNGTLVVQNDKLNTLSFISNITQSFTKTYATGSTYTVSVKTQPIGQTCNLGSNATGIITSNITVVAACTIQKAFFGADFVGSNVWPPTDGLGNIPTLGGMRLWGGNVQWAMINTAQNTYDWTNMDVWISDAQSEGWDVLYTFANTPQWAGSIPAGNPCLAIAGPYSCSAPNDLNTDGTGTDADWSNFVTALVSRYKGQIAFYELWDEPDCTCYFAGTTAQMVRMSADAAAIIRSLDPAARILSPSAHGPTMRTWFDGYVAAGGAASFDIVNAHMRGANLDLNSIPESFLVEYADVIAETAKRSLTNLPVWDDEHGIKIGQLSDPDELAGYVARSAILRAGVGLQRQYVYTWDEGDTLGLQGNSSGTAWDVVAGWLIGHSITACLPVGTIYTCAVDNGQIVWDTAQTCSNGVCTTSPYIYPPAYVWQTDIGGVKTRLSGLTVPIGYKPIFLTSN